MNPRQGECGDSEMSIIFSPLVLELIHIHVSICTFIIVSAHFPWYKWVNIFSQLKARKHQTLINQNIEEHLIKGLACEQLLPL